jgi:hypothetical protein
MHCRSVVAQPAPTAAFQYAPPTGVVRPAGLYVVWPWPIQLLTFLWKKPTDA